MIYELIHPESPILKAPLSDVSFENFKEMLEEQKKTNQLLVKMNEDPSLASSIKQNLGEILNASRLAGSSEKFQKREGITEVDEAQKKTTETKYSFV